MVGAAAHKGVNGFGSNVQIKRTLIFHRNLSVLKKYLPSRSEHMVFIVPQWRKNLELLLYEWL